VRKRSEISERQPRAHQRNPKRGGVKTQEGINVSKFNAVKHGILSDAITDYDKGSYEEIHDRLKDDYRPLSTMEVLAIAAGVLILLGR